MKYAYLVIILLLYRVSLFAVCPIIDTPSTQIESLCQGDTPDFVAAEASIIYTDSDGEFAGIGWYLDVNLTNETNPTTYTLSHSGSCQAETIVLYAGIKCSNSPPIAAGQINVTIYPNPTKAAPQGGCSLIINDNCSVGSLVVQYSNNNGTTWDAVPNSNPIDGDELDWRTFVAGTPDNNDDGNPDCMQTGIVIASCTGCPNVTSSASEVENLCEGDTPDFANAENDINFNDPNNQSEGIAWYEDANLTIEIATSSYNLPHSGDCQAETIVVYAGVKCSSGTPIAAGQINVIVYPNPTTAASAGGCSLIVNDNCSLGNLIIQYSDDNGTFWDATPNSSPSNGESLDWRAFVSGTPDNDGDGNPDCMQTGIVIASCTGCPNVTSSASEVENLCEGDTPDFTTAENDINFNDPNNQSEGIAWYEDANLTIEIPTSSYNLPHSGDCQAETIIVYAGVKCSSGTPIAAGQINVTVYPNPTTAASAGGCSLVVNDNCNTSNLIIQYSEDGGASWNATPNSDPINGEALDWRAFVTGTPDNDDDGNPDCMQTGTVTAFCTGCPTLISSALEVESLCQGDTPNFANTESDINFNDPNSQFEGIAWYIDANLSNEINTDTYTLSHSGNCEAETIVLYAGLKCSSGSPIAAGQINVTVYPIPTTAAPQGGCSLIINDNCSSGNLIIQYLNTTNNSADWIAFVSGTPDNDNDGVPDCVQTGTVVADCTGCPTITNSTSSIENLCQGDTPNFANAESNIQFEDPDNQSEGIAWFQEPTLNNEINIGTYSLPHSGSCQVETIALYAGLKCSSGSPIAAGQINVTVYPIPTTATPVGGCSLIVNDNCSLGSGIIQYSDDNGLIWTSIPNLNPIDGESSDWRFFISGTPNNNGDGNPDCVQTGTVIASCIDVNIEEESLESNIHLYPNPAKNQFFIQFNNVDTHQTNIKIYNLLGEMILQISPTQNQSNQHIIPVKLENQVAAGMYFVNIYTPKRGISKKIILQAK